MCRAPAYPTTRQSQQAATPNCLSDKYSQEGPYAVYLGGVASQYRRQIGPCDVEYAKVNRNLEGRSDPELENGLNDGSHIGNEVIT